MVTEDGVNLCGGHTVQYTSSTIKMHTRNLYDPINLCNPNKFNFNKKVKV